jgi:membrane protein DedA with SNARE-associated domain
MADLFSFLGWLDRYIDLLQNFLASRVVLAPLLLLFIEECGVPLPVNGDIILAYTGYRLSLNPSGPGIWQAFIAAQIAALAGATVLFFISRRWGQAIITKIGKFIFLKEEHIKKAERLFARWGIIGIIVGRHIPGFRIPVTIFAATAGVKYSVFLFSTFISTSIWILFYLIIGRRIGASFHTQIQQYVGATVGVVVGVVVLFIIIHLIGLYRESRGKNPEI